MSMDAAIQVEKLSYSYAGGRTALHDLSFTIQRDENVGLVGPNGAGKTTLFLCLSGVLRARAEMLRVVGLQPTDPAERRLLPAHVGILFQNSDDQVFSTTVAEDVAFGPLNLGLPREEIRRRVTEGLERVGLTGFEDRVPFHLSGGEKRRVALAGVLAMRPEILLLDEPTIFLDPRGRRQFIELLRGLPGTKVIAAHDLELIHETCSRVLVLDAGRIVADGPTATLLRDASLMEAHGLEVPWSLRKPTAD